MNTVGVFAGRGDVVLGYVFAVLAGVWLGWQLRALRDWLRRKKAQADA